MTPDAPNAIVEVRPATVADGPVLQDLEVRAGQAFATVGLPDVAGDDPIPLDALAAYATDGRAAVAVVGASGAEGRATATSGTVVGYVVVDRVDGAGHIEQVSVDPDHQGRGIGRLLVEWAAGWARTEGFASLTLTTFRDVPWNAPLYAHLGFVALDPADRGPELAALMAAEADGGLDPAARVAMRLAVP